MRSHKLFLVVASMLGVFGATDLSAHRRDEYLQAARIAIAPDRVGVELDLTPGIAIADALIAEIDGDRDGRISEREQLAYAAAVSNGLTLAADGRELSSEMTVVSFPDAAALRSGDAIIRLRSATTLPRLPDGRHQLSFRNTHHIESSVYLANALAPDGDRIVIDQQRRDPDQRVLVIDYKVIGGTAASLQIWLVGCFGAAAALAVLMTKRAPIVTERAPA